MWCLIHNNSSHRSTWKFVCVCIKRYTNPLESSQNSKWRNSVYINDNAFINVSATSTIVEGFSPNEMINVSVSATNALGEGPTSEPVTVTTHESSKHLY